ncbi:MAG TPA: SufD family Fe-S cluster assembly protein [Dissulfurispiraceae bacterium]|nr:SufD family Fe-S cluster assembly protein [Dissulfurispiraceae bacterium]
MSEIEHFLKALRKSGEDRTVFGNERVAHLVADGNKILSARTVEGLVVRTETLADGISADVTVRENVRIENPVHLCFGVLHKEGMQRIIPTIRLEPGSSAHFVAHCFFPTAKSVTHMMDGDVDVGEGAEMRYTEAHFHGPYGGVRVIPKARVRVRSRARYTSDFSLITGRVGHLDIDYRVELDDESIVEMTARVFGHADDRIIIREEVILSGVNARSLIKTRVALENDAVAEITGITEGRAAGSRGHVDCMEIVRDRAVAKAIPIVTVTNPLAKVTHEAAIGSVDKRQMETLMAHGLTPEEAVDVIVRGILK